MDTKYMTNIKNSQTTKRICTFLNNNIKSISPLSSKYILTAFIMLAAALTLLIVFLLIGKSIGLDLGPIVTAGSAAALFVSAIIALHSLKNVEEPWVKTSREFHHEFWNDEGLAKARKWLCCNNAYKNELLPILEKRLKSDDLITAKEYETLEALDKFFSFMVRVATVDTYTFRNKKFETWEEIGFMYWFNIIENHQEICCYVSRFWEPLQVILVELPENINFGEMAQSS